MTPFVGRLQSLGNLQGESQRLLHRNRTLADPLRQRRSLDQLQYQRADVSLLLQPVDHADVGMIERSQDFRFPLKPPHSLPIPDKLLRQDLQRTSRPNRVSVAR